MKDNEPDFGVELHGSIVLFRPLNGTAEEHLVEHTEPDAPWYGDALACEHRFVEDLARGLSESGFILKIKVRTP